MTDLVHENTMLRAQLAAVHEHLHAGRIDAAHEAIHCSERIDPEAALMGTNLAPTTAENGLRFAQRFNALCAEHSIQAGYCAFFPSATKAGYTSIQLGGNVQVIQWLRSEMGAGPTRAVGTPTRTGRNDPCWCGSGKKFKHCHLGKPAL